MSASLDLARRAVACRKWRWMPGMLDAARGRVAEVVDIEDMHDGRERQMALVVPSEGPQRVGPPRAVRSYFIEQLDAPDLDDPATLGCLENALVPEAWGGDVFVSVDTHRVPDGRIRTVVIIDSDGEQDPGEWAAWSKAEALVAALEAAP